MEPSAVKEVMTLVSTYGLAAVLCILGAFGIWRLMNRLLDESFKRDERMFSEAAKRDERIANILDNSLKALSKSIESMGTLVSSHDARAQEAIISMRESDKYQREEHTEMIQALSEITMRLKGGATR